MLKPTLIILGFTLITLCSFGAWLYVKETSYVVEIRNQSSKTIADIFIQGGGIEKSLGSLSPNKSVRTRFWVKQDGHLMYHSGEHLYPHVFDGYVTPNLGGHATIIIDASGDVHFLQSAP